MEQTDNSVLVAVIGGLATVCVAIIGVVVTYLASKRERRRQIYGEAVRWALSWEGLLYRIRRRTEDEAGSIIQRFHEVQDQVTYQRAWIASESRYMARSYDRLVEDVKRATEDLIREAWSGRVRPVPGNALPDDKHPNLSDATDRFMRDVRSHLSPMPWRRVAVWWRNRET